MSDPMVILLFVNMLVALLGLTFSTMTTIFVVWFMVQVFALITYCQAYFLGAMVLLILAHFLLSSIFFNTHSHNEIAHPATGRPYKISMGAILFSALSGSFITLLLNGIQKETPYMVGQLFAERKVMNINFYEAQKLIQEGDNLIILLFVLLFLMTAIGCLRILQRKFLSNADDV